MKKILILLTYWSVCFANTPNICNQMDEVIVKASNRAFKEFDNGRFVYGCNDIKLAYRSLETKHYRYCGKVEDVELMLTYKKILEEKLCRP